MSKQYRPAPSRILPAIKSLENTHGRFAQQLPRGKLRATQHAILVFLGSYFLLLRAVFLPEVFFSKNLLFKDPLL